MAQLPSRWTNWSCIVALVGTVGCGRTESEFLAAINADDTRKLCVDQSEFGVDTYSSRDGKAYVAARDAQLGRPGSSKILDAFREAGYVEKNPVTIQVQFAPTTVYELTAKGRERLTPRGVCIGEKRATEIVDYTEPQSGAPIQATQANFKYEVKLDDWVRDLHLGDELQTTLPALRNRDGKGQATFVKTNKGWRLELAMWQGGELDGGQR